MPPRFTLLPEFELRDDRGRPVALQRSEMAANIAGSPVGEGEWLLGLVTGALPVVLPGAAFAYLYLFLRWPAQVTVLPVCGALVAGLIVRAVVLRMTAPLAGVRLSLPCVLAHGHCGACGYGVAGTPSNADGLHTCPECGAEWHRDRMVFAGRSPGEKLTELRRAASLTRQAGIAQSDTGWVDDRGVALTTPFRWPRGVFRSVTPPHGADARAALNKRLGRAALIFISVVWVVAGLFVLMLLLSQTLRVGEKVGWSVALVVLAAVIHVLARMARMLPGDVRSTVLAHGLCPSCWGVMRAAEGEGGQGTQDRVEFDGCLTCRGCRAAWFSGDVG